VTAYGQVATATDTIGDIISNNAASMLLDPTVGRQLEAGVKQTLPDRRAEWTLAVYHIVKKNLLTSVVGRPGEVQQVGSQSSRGVEATGSLDLSHGVRVEGNVALLDARFDDFVEDVGTSFVSRRGNTPPSAPERSVNLSAVWNGPSDWLFRASLRSVGPRFWDNTNTSSIPTYTVVDAGIRKRLSSGIVVDLFLYNLTDELYATDFYYNGFAPQWMLGAPRSAELSVTIGLK
jgi:iron complex outermembrane receptor protein